MNLFQRKATGKLNVGIEVRDTGLAIAVCGGHQIHDEQTKYELRKLKILDKEAAQDDLVTALSDWVDAEDLKGYACNITLKSGSYQLLLTDAPEVPESELRSAVRWKINDLINIPLEKAAIEAFLLPTDGSKSGKKLAYVVVTEMQRIKDLITLVKEAGLILNSIDISEMSLRNLSLLKTEGKVDGRGIAIVRVSEGSAIVHMYRGGNLYLSRHFNLNYGGGLLDEIPEDNFLLEVQRSLDYFERQMGQVPPAMLYVCGENISADKLTQSLVRGLSVPLKFLDLEKLFVFSEELELDLFQECASALGAAIREQVA